MKCKKKFADQILGLLSKGKLTFSSNEAPSLFGLSASAFMSASQRAINAGLLVRPRHGFYVVVPPQSWAFGAPPANQVIDALMKHEQAPYYVGLLKAAEVHGAAHQAVMSFQVVTSKRMPPIPYGRGAIEFYFVRRMPPPQLLIKKQTEAGLYNVSSPSLTAADLLRYRRASGSLDAAATVIADLAEMITEEDVSKLSGAISTPTLQRLGYIFDLIGAQNLADTVKEMVGPSARRVELDTFMSKPEDGTEAVDERWKVVVRRDLELDHDSEELSARMG